MNRSPESRLHFRCPNGHAIQADVRDEGRKSQCPVCAVAVTVCGKQSAAIVPITDSGVCRLLSEADTNTFVGIAQPSSVIDRAPLIAPQPDPHKHCPRCSYPMEPNQTICPDCRQLLESSRSVFKRICVAAMRGISR